MPDSSPNNSVARLPATFAIGSSARGQAKRLAGPFSAAAALAGFVWAVTLSCWFLPLPLSADDLSPREHDLFENHVRPTLVAHCLRCHGPKKQESGLKLTSLAELLAGGESGPAIVPGQPERSLLLEALRYESLEMPPEGRLPASTVRGFQQWIEAGAPWPSQTVLRATPQGTNTDHQWWCYQPLDDPAVPVVDDDGWCRNEIDHFVFARLAARGIRPGPEATRARLTRRVHFAITGLPPSAQTQQASSQQDESYDSLVSRLLESPAYGENQARYWLDLVRYAESDGYRADHARPEAHHYRDYVIRSFQADKPYDRFVTEQLAGDEIDPGNRDALIATMYLRHWIYEWNQRDVELQWQEILNDITETTADVFLAQGLKCARCHDHKFDPLLQHDYYRLRAFFAAFQPREDLPVADLQTRTSHFHQQRKWEQATDDIRRRLHEIERPVLLEHSTREGVQKFVAEIRAMLEKRPSERSSYEHQIASLASRQFDVHPDKLTEWLDEPSESRRRRLHKQLASFDSLKPPPLPTLQFVASDVGPVAPPTFLPDDPTKTPILPGFPAVLDDRPPNIIPPPPELQSTGRRTALARWLTNPNNPLTARVIVNRIWQQHFGRGLVETVNDFGHLGQPPTHPELLDWLARRFVADGWSLKQLHRRILTSATYRQSSQRQSDQLLATVDPDNELLWRMNPRRLTGEEITDTLLSAAGQLKGGKGRAIYQPLRRNQLDPLLALFDLPDRIRSSGQRHQTTTPTQALLMTNGTWPRQQAATVEARLAETSDPQFVRAAHRDLLGREPAPSEVELALEFLANYEKITPSEPASVEDCKLVEMPGTGGRALSLAPDSSFRLGLPFTTALPDRDFTIEAVVLLRSLYTDAKVRTIVAHWTGNQKQPGWSLGVTSQKSRYQPGNLILQLVGRTASGEHLHYEVIPSDLKLELNKPYYLAVSVELADTTRQGVTFFLKDVSRPDAPRRSSQVSHRVMSGIRPHALLQVGGRQSSHRWDGLIDHIRIYDRSLSSDQLPTAAARDACVDWHFESREAVGRDSSAAGHHAQVYVGNQTDIQTPRQRARVALIGALFCSNELIYVD